MNEIFYAYHVVTNHPMYPGQNIFFDEHHHSGVYLRVVEQLDIVETIYREPQKFENQELEYPVVVALREMALEQIRKEKYPAYPSRMSCLYVSETLEEAERWEYYFNSLGRTTFGIVKLQITGNKFIGDSTKCFYATTNKEENLRMAELYWENADDSADKPGIKEILVDGEIEVVGLINRDVIENVESL